MSQPEKVFRIGFVSASVFRNEIQAGNGEETRTLRSVSLQRRYRDGDEWRSSTSFGLAELPAAIRVLELATRHIESKEAAIKQ